MGRLIAACLLMGWMSVGHSAIMSYDITIANTGWVDTNGTPFGMPLSPTLTGTMVVDDAYNDINALVSFSLTTGSHTWTEAEFVGGSAQSFIFSGGQLLAFSLSRFYLGGDSMSGAPMWIYSNNTFNVADGAGAGNFCNGCVSFAPSPVPVPAAAWLFGSAMLGLFGLARHRKA